MKVRFLAALLAAGLLSATAHAELDTVTYVSHDGGGDGRVEGDMTGANPVTLYDEPGVGDSWNGGDQFIYLHEENRRTDAFTATVRVVSQTEAIDGRWGKAGIRATSGLDGNAGFAFAEVYSGNGSQVDPPEVGDHSPVPIRLGGRTGNDGQGGFERAVVPSRQNNVFPFTEDSPSPANMAWLTLSYNPATNSYWSTFADDVDGQPSSEVSYSPVANDVPAAPDGVYIGLAYSAHNSLDPAVDHGITFDNWSIGELQRRPRHIGGDNIADVIVKGTLTDIERGPDVVKEGLGQYWYGQNMRNNPEGFSTIDPVNDSPFTTDTTWWGGNQGLSGAPGYPDVPELANTKFAGNPGNVDNYGVRLFGEIFLRDGEYVLRDGIDDYTMVRIDLNRDGDFDGDILPPPGGNNAANDEVVIHDDAWNNINGEGGGLGTADEIAYFDVDGAPNGAWHAIEVYMGEGGGGDGGVLYMSNLDEDDDVLPEDGGVPASFAIPNDQLRVSLPGEILSGTSVAQIDSNSKLVMQLSSSRLDADKYIVAEAGNAKTVLDVGGGQVELVAMDELVPGDEFVLFVADELTGVDSLDIQVPAGTEGQWDFSGLGEGGPDGHRIKFLGGFIAGDCNGDGAVDAADLACVANISDRDTVLAAIGSLPGDLDGNGEVGFPDFLTLSANFGQQGGYTDGNIDLAGDIGFPDFLALSDNFGKAAAASAVPEPSSVALLGLGGLLLGCLRRRRK